MNESEIDAKAQVIVYVNGLRWVLLQCDMPRDDLEILGKGRSDFGFRYKFFPELPLDSELRIDIRFAATGQILPAGEKIVQAERRDRGIDQILVTAPARSGTTLLMKKLLKTDHVVGADMYPFETRLLAYYATALRVLTSGADLDRSMHPDCLEGNGFWVGFNPFNLGVEVPWFTKPERSVEFFGQYVPVEIARTFRRVIVEYYLRAKDDQNKFQATYFAEKSNNLNRFSREYSRKIFPEIKEILIARDPRDRLCSHSKYFKVDRKSTVDDVIDSSNELLRLCDELSENMLIVKYEDLVNNNPVTYGNISSFLNVKIEVDEPSPNEQAIFKIHGTTNSPASSIGQWKNELDSETVAKIEDRCGEFLSRLNYMR